MQSGYDAMQSNPLYYSNSNIKSTSFQFPSSARQFKEGSKYAWQVEAYLNGDLLSSSEINDFTYGEIKKVVKTKELKMMKKYWGSNLEGNNDGYMAGTNLIAKRKHSCFHSELFGESANRSGTGSIKSQGMGILT